MIRYITAAAIVIVLFAITIAFHPGEEKDTNPFVTVLGIAQDGGYPHAACKKSCCAEAWKNPSRKRMVSCLAVVDPVTSERWIFDATPDFSNQLHLLDQIVSGNSSPTDPNTTIGKSLGLTGIFLTHAHIGHYTGIMYLGREAIGAPEVPVYAMPRMREFLANSGPWSQLITLKNIAVKPLEDNVEIKLNERISVTPFKVPHRDEYSETVGFLVKGPRKSFIFIPDINKWEVWNTKVEDMIARVDYAYLDATFFADGEIPGVNMSAIPHPFVTESMKRFGPLPEKEKKKIRFIHLNHTNPALVPGSDAQKQVKEAGFNLAEEKEKFSL